MEVALLKALGNLSLRGQIFRWVRSRDQHLQGVVCALQSKNRAASSVRDFTVPRTRGWFLARDAIHMEHRLKELREMHNLAGWETSWPGG